VGGPRRNREREVDCPYDIIAGVAVIPVKGILIQRLGWMWWYGELFGVSGYDRIRYQFMHALANDAVDAIAFDVDSPGGDVAGCFDLVDTIYGARHQADCCNSGRNAYSAAYAIASAVDPGRLWVPRTGGTGSVGVIYIHLSIADWLAKSGITPTLITKGAFKGEGSEMVELSKGRARVCKRISTSSASSSTSQSRETASSRANRFSTLRPVPSLALMASTLASPTQFLRRMRRSGRCSSSFDTAPGARPRKGPNRRLP
jgi:ClpP class serine protease